MTSEQYREKLEEQDLEELMGSDAYELWRNEYIEGQVEAYADALEEQSDEELFGESTIESMREELIEDLLTEFEEKEQ